MFKRQSHRTGNKMAKTLPGSKISCCETAQPNLRDFERQAMHTSHLRFPLHHRSHQLQRFCCKCHHVGISVSGQAGVHFLCRRTPLCCNSQGNIATSDEVRRSSKQKRAAYGVLFLVFPPVGPAVPLCNDHMFSKSCASQTSTTYLPRTRCT